MKFTRSLAENAMARAKVPTRTMGLKILMRVKRTRIWNRKAKATKLPESNCQVLVLIQDTASGVRKEEPLAPLMRMKYVMMDRANPPYRPPYRFMRFR